MSSAPKVTLSQIPLRLYANNDARTPIKEQKERVLVVEGQLDEQGLRKALQDYYAVMRSDLSSSGNPTRHVWLFAYPSEARAKTGRGEWQGRASAMAFNGEPLPTEPEITIRLPEPDKEPPTQHEQEVYDALMDELASRDSAGAYQEEVMRKRGALSRADIERMTKLSERDEGRAMKAIAKRYKMSVKKLEELHTKVAASRM